MSKSRHSSNTLVSFMALYPFFFGMVALLNLFSGNNVGYLSVGVRFHNTTDARKKNP